MQPGSVRCPRCGWQGSASDRMCGGCGAPLFHSGATPGTPTDYAPTIASSGAVAPPPLSPETRSASWAPPAYPQQVTPGTATVAATSARAAPPYAAAPSASPARRRGCLGRTLIALAIATLLVVVIAACGWAAVIRPALHTSFDQHLRAGLAAEVDKVPVVPESLPAIKRTFYASDFNNRPVSARDQGDMKDVRIHFLPGQVVMTYQLWGRPGKISTQVIAVNGRLLVQNTQVEGWLIQFENGDELQDALNASLARLPAQDYVESVIVGDGTLTLTLRHA